jgi:hypothetical protein
MLTVITLACLWLCPHSYVQNGYLFPEGWLKAQEKAQIAAEKPGPKPVEPSSPPPTTASAPSPNRKMGDGNVEQWRGLVEGYFPPEQVENALCAIKSESGGNPNAKNQQGSEARGLFQVMASTWDTQFGWTWDQFYDPENNAYAAAWIWRTYGWSHWSVRTQNLCHL